MTLFGDMHMKDEFLHSVPTPERMLNYTQLSFTELITSNETTTPPEAFTELFEVPIGVAALLLVSYGAVFLVAVVGNICVLWVVISRRRMRTVTNYFIGNLALADVVIGLLAVPFQFQAALLQKWLLPAFMCAFCPFIQVLSVNVSVFTLSAIAFDRYISVLHPFKRQGTSKLSAKLIILCIWLFGALAASPYLIAYHVTFVYNPPTGDFTRPFCANTGVSTRLWGMYQYGLVALQYVLPLCFIAFAYGKMGMRLRMEGCVTAPRDDTVLKNKKKVIKMLSIVVALFGICWLPFQTYNVLQEMMPQINEYKYINVIWFFAHWLAMSNSCYNPFIYAIYNI
ncbi:tachykinin-like peptides receptor 99D [Uloborus diversus]|uniref:tachykinin-like peptides receptor 99D n=1 Tax=Uloborus diversus TaxID=327109 RepID=UPI002409A8B5|nr:tachykinin-like peptides receptor 99D [Uloborus diversus]